MRYAAFLVLTLTASLVFAEGHKNNERENTVEIVMSAWRHLAKIDMEKFNEYLTDDFTWTFMGTSEISATYKIDDFSKLVGSIVENLELNMDRIIADKSGAVIIAEGVGKGKTGNAYNNRYAFVFTIKDGLISAIHEYSSDLLVERALLGK